MPTHHEPFCSHSCILHHHTRYSLLTGSLTMLQRSPSQHASISGPQGGRRSTRSRVPPVLPLPPSLPLPTPPRLPHVVRASAAALKRQRACAPEGLLPPDTTDVTNAAPSQPCSYSIWSCCTRYRWTTRTRIRTASTVVGLSNNGSRTATRTSAYTQRHQQRTDDVEAQDAFLPGMIFTPSSRLLPGAPYTPVDWAW